MTKEISNPVGAQDGNPIYYHAGKYSFLSPSAQYVRAARAKLGLTRPALATLLGVDIRTIDGWETRRNAPRIAFAFLAHLSGLPAPPPSLKQKKP